MVMVGECVLVVVVMLLGSGGEKLIGGELDMYVARPIGDDEYAMM